MASSSGRVSRNSSEKMSSSMSSQLSPLGCLADPLGLDAQQLLLVVPLVEGLGLVEALVALQADQAGPGHLGHRLGQLGLAGAGRALDQDRLAQPLGQVHHAGDAVVGEVADGAQPLPYLGGRLEAGWCGVAHGCGSLPLDSLSCHADLGPSGRLSLRGGGQSFTGLTAPAAVPQPKFVADWRPEVYDADLRRRPSARPIADGRSAPHAYVGMIFRAGPANEDRAVATLSGRSLNQGALDKEDGSMALLGREFIAVPDDRKHQIVFKWPDHNIRKYTRAIVNADEMAMFVNTGQVVGHHGPRPPPDRRRRDPRAGRPHRPRGRAATPTRPSCTSSAPASTRATPSAVASTTCRTPRPG